MLVLVVSFPLANPTHEKQIGRALRNLRIPVSLSHVILPEYREYERTSTIRVNACLAPVMGRFLGGLQERLRQTSGHHAPRLCVMQSNGGAGDVANANMESAIRLISVERGYDPRQFTLITFGGAGRASRG